MSDASAGQIDLAARGAAWGDAVGVALSDNLGPLKGQVTNFLIDAAQGTAEPRCTRRHSPVSLATLRRQSGLLAARMTPSSWKAVTGKCGGRRSYAEAKPDTVALARKLRERRMSLRKDRGRTC
jgi:hypothetical protein